MKITFLGTGAALADPDRCQSSILITLDNGRNFLFDCGEGATRQMVKANINPADVDWVFLSHMHFDHICGLPFFVLSSWIFNRVGAPRVFGPKGTQAYVDHLFEDGAFKIDFTARNQYAQRKKNPEAIRPQVKEVAPGLIYEDRDVKVYAEWVEHIPRDITECFGVRLEAEGKSISFSGDTSPCDAMVKLGRDADVFIHECTFPEAFIEHRRKSNIGTFAHTSPTELGKLAARANAKSVVATHFGHFDSLSPVLKRAAGAHMLVDEMGPHQMDIVAADIRKHYSGPIHLAHDLMRLDV